MRKAQCCPECGSSNLMRDYDAAEIVCMSCGFVVAEKLADRGPEWRAFDAEQRDKKERMGAPLTYAIHDKGLSTGIERHDIDSFRRKLSPAQKARAWRLRKWQRRIRAGDVTERNLAFALGEMQKIRENLNLPKNVLETASVIYRRAVKEHLIRGRSIKSMTAAAVYVACRQCEVARTLEQIADASNINKKEVGRNYRFLVRGMDLYQRVPRFKANGFIRTYCDKLSSSGKSSGRTEEIAFKIYNMVKKLKLTDGRDPKGQAAAITYMSSVLAGERKTQRELAEIAQCTEVTIRNRYKELVEKLMFEVYM